MKKAGILMLTLVLVAAMFSGCRRRTDESTNTTMAPTTTTTQTTTRATMPSTTMTRPATTGVIPDATDLLPDGTSGTGATGSDMGRGRMGPRY